MPSDLTNLYSGYQRASRYSPVAPSTLRKALKPYGIRMASLQGKSDSQLRQMAITAVLAKRQKGAASAPGLKPRGKPKTRVTPMPRTGGRHTFGDPVRRPRRRGAALPPRYQI